MKTRSVLKVLLPVLVLVVLTVAVSTPIYAQRILTPTTSDYDAHIMFTLRILKRDLPPTFVLAHPLLELVIGFIYWAGRGHIGLWETAVLVQVLAQVATALILYLWIGRQQRRWGEALRVFFALSLTLVAPVMLLAPLDKKFFFGYIGLASYHNPTVHLLRPFALGSFYFAARAFTRPKNPAWMVALAALFMLGGMLTKPNFGMALLPGLGALALWFLWKRRPLDWWMLIVGQVLPALAMLALQAELIYLIPDADNVSVVIAPFAVESFWSGYLPLKFLLSILFPLGVLGFVVWSPRIEPTPSPLPEGRGRISALQKLQTAVEGMSVELQLAWLTFFFAVVQLYLFAETGGRFTHGNFRWGAQIALFVLFTVSVKELLRRELAEKLSWRQRVPLYGLYLLHLAAGITYYVYCFLHINYD